MAEDKVTLNQGQGGQNVAGFTDTSARFHQEVVVQTQSAGADPISVSSTNPMPTAAVGNVGAGVADSGNAVKVGGVYNASPPSLSSGNRGDLQLDNNGNVCVNIKGGMSAGGTASNVGSAYPTVATAAGASDGTLMKPLLVDGSGNLKVNIAAGGVTAATDNTAFTANSTTGLSIMGVYNDGISNLTSGNQGGLRLTATRQLITTAQPNGSAGWTPYKLISAAGTNATSVKASPGTVGFIQVGNTNAYVVCLKLYNKASAPTVGTDVPVQTYMVPGNANGAGLIVGIPGALYFSTGIAFALTQGNTDTDTTAVSQYNTVVNLGWL